MNNIHRRLREKIEQTQASIVVIGLGYVGLPLALGFAAKGFRVTGFDTNAKRVDAIGRGESYITDVPSDQLRREVKRETFSATTDVHCLADADVVIICVPTPIKRKYTPDVSYMLSAVKSVAEHVKPGTLVVLESTTYPGTTEELIQPALEKGGLKVGKNVFLAFSPERIDPGNPHFDVCSIPKVVGGMTAACTDLTAALYSKAIEKIHPVSSCKAAEMTKLLENSFRIVNIGWINEIAQTCHTMGIDVWEVIEAAKTKPFGFMPFYPGLGVGGHCIPEDPLYLYWKAKKYGFNSKFIRLAADVNAHMPQYAVQRLEQILSKPLSKAKILVLGVTYKKDIKDLRKSPSLRLMELLKTRSQVEFHDPMVPYLKIGTLAQEGVALGSKALRSFDCVIIAVDHTKVDYEFVRREAKLIFDVRNVYKTINDRKIIRL